MPGNAFVPGRLKLICPNTRKRLKNIFIFGIKIGKVMEWDFIKKYYLFGIKVFQKKKQLP